jgi:hypothetical protein
MRKSGRAIKPWARVARVLCCGSPHTHTSTGTQAMRLWTSFYLTDFEGPYGPCDLWISDDPMIK